MELNEAQLRFSKTMQILCDLTMTEAIEAEDQELVKMVSAVAAVFVVATGEDAKAWQELQDTLNSAATMGIFTLFFGE